MRLLAEDRAALAAALEGLVSAAKAAAAAPDTDALKDALCTVRDRARNTYQLTREAEERARKNALEGVE